jgi:16S rRNA (guanine527-N7)-methyltransferase
LFVITNVIKIDRFTTFELKFLEQLLHYFPNLTSFQQQQYKKMFSLYVEWNAQINVISRKDMDGFYVRHVLHALAIAKYIHFQKGTRVFDVGTGGGFPGIPLAVFFPEVEFHLIDSIGKKIKVINAVAESLKLTNVATHNTRMEQLPLRADFVVCRAVAPMETLVHWVGDKIQKTSQNIIPNGLLCLKGGDLSGELTAYPKAAEMALKNYFSDAFFETKKLVYLPR